MAVAALVLGSIGLFGIIPIIGWFFIIFNVLAIIFGLIGLSSEKDKDMATAGIIIGAIPILAKVVTWLLIILPVSG